MISKNTIKLIKSLAIKKYRQKEKMFLVEGDKIVLEVLQSEYHVSQLFATNEFLSANKNHIKNANIVTQTTKNEIRKASLLKNPQNCLALCELSAPPDFPKDLNGNLTMYLDGIQDPGNLGTIIRICDWFGIDQVFCSPDTVNIYSPKVIQSSMGSFCQIQVWYTQFENILKLAGELQIPIIGAFLEGSSIFHETLPERALLVVGNEGNGISDFIEDKIMHKITIPKFTQNREAAESLNVAVATAIICAEFKRQHLL